MRYPQDSDYTEGYRYPPFEQLRPAVLRLTDLGKTL